MMCGGCEGAVRRVLTKMPGPALSDANELFEGFRVKLWYELCMDVGVESVDIDLPANKVVVKGDVEPQAVYNTAAKTGKKTEFWS